MILKLGSDQYYKYYCNPNDFIVRASTRALAAARLAWASASSLLTLGCFPEGLPSSLLRFAAPPSLPTTPNCLISAA